jgi:phage terminase Nu1 subunit (DNA packaging protein)
MGEALTEAGVAALVARYPLPAGVHDVVLNREELAEALGTSLNTVSAWINSGMPVQAIGTNGRPYELRLSHCFAWNEARKHGEEVRGAEAREAISAMRLALVGGKSGDSIEALDPKQRRDILMAQHAYEELAKARNQLIPRRDVVEAFETACTIIRDALEVAPDRLERLEPLLTPKAIDALVEMHDDLILTVRKRLMEEFWEVHPERGGDFLREGLFEDA